MKIIIPMTGHGSRFHAAGYTELKPFINVLGRPIIQWIVDGIYPNEKDIFFICRREHLLSDNTMEKRLLSIAPTAQIFAIDDWIKKGPVYDVLCASKEIADNQPCLINYCDFYLHWNWDEFKQEMLERDCDGCIPCYTGFHPNLMLKKNVYASCLTDDNDDLIEIREKFSFEKNKAMAKHSAGVYYFKTGSLMKKYCWALVESDQAINGEYYASLPYNFMVRDGLKVWVPTNIEYFCQWGTPEDLRDFLFWVNIVRGWQV